MIEVFHPSKELSNTVEGYWASWTNTSDKTYLLPDGRVDVVLELSHGAGSAAIYGSVTSPTWIPVKPQASYVGIRFRPGMARHFIVPEMSETNDAVLEDSSLLRFRVDRALEASTLHDVVAALSGELLRYKRQVIHSGSRVDRMIEQAVRTRGMTSVGDLASSFGVSTRQVERDFKEALGMNPKAFLAIQRFLHARSLLRQGLAPALAAIDAGYSDQSHMHRDMRKFAAQTPRHCSVADVGFFQDQTASAWNHRDFHQRKESTDEDVARRDH